eukprot:snap_masked-scaffold_1-processed-gene-23.59-mRNA-1 protein AED:1.00 eAED:1.00 QI:0/0/0/0/1/1/3/0/62
MKNNFGRIAFGYNVGFELGVLGAMCHVSEFKKKNLAKYDNARSRENSEVVEFYNGAKYVKED